MACCVGDDSDDVAVSSVDKTNGKKSKETTSKLNSGDTPSDTKKRKGGYDTDNTDDTDDTDKDNKETNEMYDCIDINGIAWKPWNNPMDGYKDPVTGELIGKPKLCKETGTVLDSWSWFITLKEDGKDPFTGDKVNNDDLILLTLKNFDEYKHLIVIPKIDKAGNDN